MSNTITSTDFTFTNQTKVYKGKVRDVYTINDEYAVLIATDRISAFDVILPKGIPFKGQILTGIAAKFLRETQNIVPNWFIDSPHPNVAIGHFCEPFKVEMVIRGYMSGHAARENKAGKRMLCGVPLPEGMKENDKFPQPIITPATKAEMGDHDEDISKEDILKIHKLTTYIIENISENISITTLSEESGLSPKKLQLGFKILYSKTVNEYVRSLKLEISKNYLKNSDLSVSEIVYAIGIKSRSYFSKIFFEAYDILPTEYRKHIKNKNSSIR